MELQQIFETTKSFNQELINQQEFFPDTSIFATTIDGELTDVINIKDCFNRLAKEEKLKVISVLLEFCSSEILREVPPFSKNELPKTYINSVEVDSNNNSVTTTGVWTPKTK
jgi:hypothetical protein